MADTVQEAEVERLLALTPDQLDVELVNAVELLKAVDAVPGLAEEISKINKPN